MSYACLMRFIIFSIDALFLCLMVEFANETWEVWKLYQVNHYPGTQTRMLVFAGMTLFLLVISIVFPAVLWREWLIIPNHRKEI